MPSRKPPFRILDRALLDPVALRVLSDPLRSFVVYSLVGEAKTARQLAGEIGCPPTRLYYHLQQLLKHGLIGVESTRLVSGIVEKRYRAAAREFVLDRASFARGKGTGAARVEALLGFVFDQTRLDIRRLLDAGHLDLARRAPDPQALVAYRNVLKLDAAQAARLYQRLHDFWQEYEALAKQPAADGRFYAFTVALYPNDVAPASTTAPPARAPRARPRKRP
jgi:hypothetical protein